MTPLIALHIALATLALALGAAVLLRKKGVWVAAMVGVAASSFWIFEIRRGAGPSFVHLLSAWTSSPSRSQCGSSAAATCARTRASWLGRSLV
jgi:uncharacterized membrane protein